MATQQSVIILGYGNPGRLDDGLGPALVERVTELGLPGVDAESGYQLNVEDAARVAQYDTALFADAAVTGPEPFSVRSVAPVGPASFTTHHVTPAHVLHLAQSLFAAEPRAYVIGIRGYDFDEFGEQLSQQARRNLDAAVAFVKETARRGWTFEQTESTDPGET